MEGLHTTAHATDRPAPDAIHQGSLLSRECPLSTEIINVCYGSSGKELCIVRDKGFFLMAEWRESFKDLII